jgi:hypothetical protein
LRSGTASPASWRQRRDDCHRHIGADQPTDRLEHTGQSEISHRDLFASKDHHHRHDGRTHANSPKISKGVAPPNLVAKVKRGVGSEPASPAIEAEPAEQKYHHEDDQ